MGGTRCYASGVGDACSDSLSSSREEDEDVDISNNNNSLFPSEGKKIMSTLVWSRPENFHGVLPALE